jgi:hypothetical protein
MRTKMLKFKAFGLLLMMVFSLISCSDDDNDDPSTFLETNGGTVWTIAQGGASIYAQINNNESNPFEFWASFGEEGCYVHESINDEGNVEVLENTENKLKVRVDDDETEYTILTLTVTGNVLTVQSEYFEDGQSVEKEIIPLQKTNDNTDDLEICEL